MSNGNVKVGSAGLCAGKGRPANQQALAACSKRGIDIAGHTARPFVSDYWTQYDVIAALDSDIHDYLRSSRPGKATARVVLFDDGISDPCGGPDEEYDAMIGQMEKSMAGFLSKIEIMN